MLKNKVVLTALAVIVFLVLATPIFVQAVDTLSEVSVTRVGYWNCAKVFPEGGLCTPSNPNAGCSGSSMVHLHCYFWCRTGNTTSPAISCYGDLLPSDDSRL
ncbi:MAG: hypothetical protein GY765_28560 [bacterium]|nr:hypothetical protein [bacterium]